MAVLAELLEFTRDGEWGSGEADEGLVKVGIIRGTDFSSVRYGDLSGIPTRYVRASVVEKKQLKPRDILIETAGGTKDQPTGRSVYLRDELFERADKPLLCASFARFLRVREGAADPRYIFWKLQDEYIREALLPFHVQHTGVARFQYTQFAANHRLDLPAELEDQAAIASTLSTLDDKIELNRRMNETLEALAQAIFKDWFVTFGPTRRKMEGATDPVAILGDLIPDPTKAAPLAFLFPDSFGQDGLPEAWEKREIGQDFHVTMGQSPPGDTYNEAGNGLPFYQGRRDFGWRFPTRRVYCSAPTRVSPADWTLVSVRAPVGDINRAWEECCIGRGVGAFMHREKLASFTYYAGLHLREELASYDKDGTVFGSINQNQFKALKICGADQTAAAAFDDFVLPIDDLIRTKTDESRTLAETRDYLLPKLMSGAVRVRNADALAE